MKLALVTLVALAVAGSALASPRSATLTIRHQTQGCHSWSLDGKSWNPTQKLSLPAGGKITVVDNDVMPHSLIQVSGPKASLTGAAMKHMGAAARISFPAKGTYVFKTRAGDDYMKGVTTTGEDNVLRLVVTVA
jgi:plastocyanin